ncbi:MAG: PTS sugar transporter subunit IIB, partial [Erysipelotrichaceae bacterium]|nr:PTS sugar transporter subunit IIB [Erysipelotrichaceae bacterium]
WLKGLQDKGVEIKEVCCGNCSDNGKDSVQVSGTLYASKADLEAYKAMVAKGVRFYRQTTPEVAPEELNEKLKNM